MLKHLKSLFIEPAGESPENLEQRLRLVAAALLIETARADFGEESSEQAAIRKLLQRELTLSDQEVSDLLEEAADQVDSATSLFEFTRLVNDHFQVERKAELINTMWRVAYADGELHKYEEALIRQVAELIYVPHADFIRGKLAARQAVTSADNAG